MFVGGGENVIMCGCFFLAYDTVMLHITEGRMYWDIIYKNLLLSNRILKQTFQQNNDPKHTVKETLRETM